MKKNFKKSGFTLIEVLLVIVVIGILAGMMMLSSDEAKYSARAATIISDFENIKAAAAAYYLDHAREIDSGKLTEDNIAVGLWSYLSDTSATAAKRSSSKADYKYVIKILDSDSSYSSWYVWCYVPEKKVMEKLKARKPNIELLPSENQDTDTPTGSSSGDIPDTGFIGIRIH